MYNNNDNESKTTNQAVTSTLANMTVYIFFFNLTLEPRDIIDKMLVSERRMNYLLRDD